MENASGRRFRRYRPGRTHYGSLQNAQTAIASDPGLSHSGQRPEPRTANRPVEAPRHAFLPAAHFRSAQPRMAPPMKLRFRRRQFRRSHSGSPAISVVQPPQDPSANRNPYRSRSEQSLPAGRQRRQQPPSDATMEQHTTSTVIPFRRPLSHQAGFPGTTDPPPLGLHPQEIPVSGNPQGEPNQVSHPGTWRTGSRQFPPTRASATVVGTRRLDLTRPSA